jgi:hypothetical protein
VNSTYLTVVLTDLESAVTLKIRSKVGIPHLPITTTYENREMVCHVEDCWGLPNTKNKARQYN